MTSFIITYPAQTTQNGTKYGQVITCNTLDKLKSELLKVVTNENIKNIKVIGMNGDIYTFNFDESGGYLTSGNNIIEVPDVIKNLYQEKKQYLVLFDDSCQIYDYNGLKDMILLIRNIPSTWKIISQPDRTVYTYDPQTNLFKASNGSKLPDELTKHLSNNYKLIMHFYEDLNNPIKTFQKEMCPEQFVSKDNSIYNVKTYLMYLTNSQKLKYEPSEHAKLYRVDIIRNDEKVGEINEIGLYFNNILVMSSLGELFQSFKKIMQSVKEIVAKNIKENPKPVLMHKLNELNTVINNCTDKDKLYGYLTTINNMI